MQYADDTILFSRIEEGYTKNLKGILMWFEQLSGTRINFHKSELIPLNVGLGYLFSCPVGKATY